MKTTRAQQIAAIRSLAGTLTSSEIGAKLGLSKHTVKRYATEARISLVLTRPRTVSKRIIVYLTDVELAAWRRDAALRGTQPGALLHRLAGIIQRDGLLNAVLDDGERNGS